MSLSNSLMHRQGKTVFCPKGHRLTVLDLNREAVLADLENLDLSVEEIRAKWGVTHHNLSAFAKRAGMKLQERHDKRRSKKSAAREASNQPLPSSHLPWGKIATTLPKITPKPKDNHQ